MSRIETRTYQDRSDYQREYQREWKHKNRDEAIKQLGGCCEVCQSMLFLEFHHQDPSKKLSHRIWTWGKERREAEIAKCRLLCKTHHERWHALYDRLQRGEAVDKSDVEKYGLLI